MKYDWKFKYQCVLNYKEGKDIPVEPFPSRKRRNSYVRIWVHLYDSYGIDGLKRQTFNKSWTQEERYELVAKVIAGQPVYKTSLDAGINTGQLYAWVRQYEKYGYDGLELRRKGRPPKEGTVMARKDKPSGLNPSEKEELILLRRKLEYMEAENAYLKKLAALVAQKKAESSAKAKRHSSSEDSSKNSD